MVMTTIEIRSPSGPLHAQVDEQDADLGCYSWHMAGGKGIEGKYAARAEILEDGLRATIYLHREIAVRMGILAHLHPRRGARGQWHVSIDHENGDKLDSRRSNLKLKTRRDQMSNPNDSLRSTNKSGVRGVTYDQARDKWYASVMMDGKTVNLHRWDTREEAETARKYWGQTGRVLPAPRAAEIFRNNTSGIRGVSLNKKTGKYLAYVSVNGKRMHLGTYPTIEEAAAARRRFDEAREETGG